MSRYWLCRAVQPRIDSNKINGPKLRSRDIKQQFWRALEQGVLLESMSEVEETASWGSEEANGRPRLMITKIVCENFKSYAGTKVLGPFHKVWVFHVGCGDRGQQYCPPGVFPFSASRPLLVLMEAESRTLSTQCCLCSATVPRRYAARRCLC